MSPCEAVDEDVPSSATDSSDATMSRPAANASPISIRSYKSRSHRLFIAEMAVLG